MTGKPTGHQDDSSEPVLWVCLSEQWQPRNRTDLKANRIFTTNLLSDPESLPLPGPSCPPVKPEVPASVCGDRWELGKRKQLEVSGVCGPYGICNSVPLISLGAQTSAEAWAPSERGVQLGGEQGGQPPEASGWMGGASQETAQEGVTPKEPRLRKPVPSVQAHLTSGVLPILFSPRPDRRGQ